jgi:hypothetical protein
MNHEYQPKTMLLSVEREEGWLVTRAARPPHSHPMPAAHSWVRAASTALWQRTHVAGQRGPIPAWLTGGEDD